MEPAFNSETPGTKLQDYVSPQRKISVFKTFNYILVVIGNVKMDSACSLEILRCISVRKAAKLYVDIAFMPHSFQYSETH